MSHPRLEELVTALEDARSKGDTARMQELVSLIEEIRGSGETTTETKETPFGINPMYGTLTASTIGGLAPKELSGIVGGAVNKALPQTRDVSGFAKPVDVSANYLKQAAPSVSSTPVENYARSQNLGGEYFGIGPTTGEHEYKGATRQTNLAKDIMAKNPNMVVEQGERGLVLPRNIAEERQAAAVEAELNRKALAEAEAARLGQQRAERLAKVKSAQTLPVSVLRSEINKLPATKVERLGGAATSGLTAYNTIDAINRATQGDITGAGISGVGGIAGLLGHAPNKYLRYIGRALAGAAPIAQSFRDQEKEKKKEEFAAGGIAGYAGGTKVVKSGLKALGDMILPPAENAARTQIIGTLPTYEKAAGILKREGASGPAIDFGAGLGEGAKFLGKDAHTFEPFAQNWTPTYSKASQIPSDLYGQLTNLNVLNVVPREARDEIVQDIGRVMRPGGLGIITTRGKDVMNAKGLAGPEANSIITSRDTYQKGFTKDELEQYLKYMLGDAFDINRLNLGPAGVLLRKK